MKSQKSTWKYYFGLQLLPTSSNEDMEKASIEFKKLCEKAPTISSYINKYTWLLNNLDLILYSDQILSVTLHECNLNGRFYFINANLANQKKFLGFEDVDESSFTYFGNVFDKLSNGAREYYFDLTFNDVSNETIDIIIDYSTQIKQLKILK